MTILWTLIISIAALIADMFLKSAAIGRNYLLLALGASMYFGQAWFWYQAYKTEKFSTVAVVYSIFTIILSVAVGVLLYHERIGAKELIGIVLGIGAVILLTS